MITVQTLENMNVNTIYQVFEDAFSDYFVSFEKKAETHIQRWLSSGVDFELSYGVKVDGKLVAFLLHAPRGDMVMNIATGVRRDYQGQGLTGLMFEQIHRELPQKGFRKARLEVITENVKGIRAYEKAGFTKTRKLLCWKGRPTSLPKIPGEHDILPVAFTDEHSALSPFPWAFEQDNSVVLRRADQLELHELRENKKLIAFAIWNPWKMNIVQLGGASENAVAGLLERMKLEGEQVGMINVDERHEFVNGAFRSHGLENYISQYEMEAALGPHL